MLTSAAKTVLRPVRSITGAADNSAAVGTTVDDVVSGNADEYFIAD